MFVCLLNFTADSFLNKKQIDADFSERLKIKFDAVLATLDLAVILQHTSVNSCLYVIALSEVVVIYCSSLCFCIYGFIY